MRRADPLEELLTYNDNAVQQELDKITAAAATERGEEPAAVDAQPEHLADDHGSEGADFKVAIQSNLIKVADVRQLSDENVDIIKEFQEKATKLVAQMIRLIDGSLPDKEILQQLRMSHVGKLDSDSLTDGTVGIFYDVKASGESQRRPQIRPPGFRKTHIDKLVTLGLRSRVPDPAKESEETAIRKNEVVILMDAFREGNSSSILSAVKIGDKVCLRPSLQTQNT